VVLGRHNLFLQNNVQFVKSSHIYWYSYFGLGHDDSTVQRIEGGKQRGRAIAFVVMSERLSAAPLYESIFLSAESFLVLLSKQLDRDSSQTFSRMALSTLGTPTASSLPCKTDPNLFSTLCL